jgi:hypothetical protein
VTVSCVLVLVDDAGTVVATRPVSLPHVPQTGDAVELTPEWPGVITQVLWKLDGTVELEVGADEHPLTVELSAAGWTSG